MYANTGLNIEPDTGTILYLHIDFNTDSDTEVYFRLRHYFGTELIILPYGNQ